MIYILETIPVKMSGKTSIAIKFDFNSEVVEFLKTFPCYYYHKKEFVWELPMNSLSDLLDGLTKIDDIKLKLLPETINENEPISNQTVSDNTNDLERPENSQLGLKIDPKSSLTPDEIYNFKEKPFAHQIEAINFGLEKEKFLLLDGCGLGKTNEIIWLAETLKARGLIDHCLIICGVNSLKQNWKKEIAKFSNLTCRVLGERITRNGTIRYSTVAERRAELMGEFDDFFVITNVEVFRSNKTKNDDTMVAALKKSKTKFGMIAIDEIHKCANKSSSQGANLLKLNAPYKVGATGTLITNNAISAYLPLSWIDAEHATLTDYRKLYCKFGGFNNAQIIGYQNLDILQEEIAFCSIRRTLDMVREDIPQKQINFELVEMDKEHADFYEAIKEGVKEEADKITLNANNCLALTTRLRQATACPSALTSQAIDSTKLERITEVVEEITSQHEKVVILSFFKESVYALAEKLKEYKPLLCTGDINETMLNKNMDQFQNDPDSLVFIGTIKKTGTGFTLNSAMYLLFVDTPWTWSDFDQGFSRIYRVNNTRPALITVYGCQGTIDEKVWEIINTKKDTGSYLVDGEMSETVASMMKEVLLGL